jgi:hypothetical protein
MNRFDPLKTNCILNNIYEFSSYLTGSTSRFRYRDQPINAVWRNIRCLLWEPYEHTNTLCRENTEFWYIEVDGTYSNHFALKGWPNVQHNNKNIEIKDKEL